MKQEDKDLLMKDLCARLPYGVECEIRQRENTSPVLHDKLTCDTIKCVQERDWCVKPYLRPMSSMTEEERKELDEKCLAYCSSGKYTDDDGYTIVYADKEFQLIPEIETYDWLNEHHFDHRGLIEKGLALPAPEGMYK